MREASTVSPFAAATNQERQARWLLWQQQSVEAVAAPVEDEPLPQRTYPMEPTVPPIQHRRYDAVVRRMQQAQRQTGAYSAWS